MTDFNCSTDEPLLLNKILWEDTNRNIQLIRLLLPVENDELFSFKKKKKINKTKINITRNKSLCK